MELKQSQAPQMPHTIKTLTP